MARFKVGVLFKPQHCEMAQLRESWRAADELGVDTVWTWDHFYPLYGDPDGAHYECWTTLAAVAADTRRARFGSLVTCNSYRNPNLLAAMAGTVDRISDGRLILGLGAGWFERDYTEFGYRFGSAPERLRALEDGVRTVRARLAALVPSAARVPLLIGGGGEKVTLRIVARYADMWNDFGSAERFAHKSAVLDRWCAEQGRDPAEIERTTMIETAEVDEVDAYLKAGATHVILGLDTPFDLEPLDRLLAHAGD
ncbi:LLM class F420-dependent oxidoreductase [Micromonospora sp. NPDC049275]|uniref:LLM class F420-dependent oxidoreductase n=1 Tax=Micromonospora sp. NPDC049275 TaxID=3364268 RepID=UPI0037223717